MAETTRHPALSSHVKHQSDNHRQFNKASNKPSIQHRHHLDAGDSFPSVVLVSALLHPPGMVHCPTLPTTGRTGH